jgi:uncharacterized protein (DUF1778 family)
MSSFDAELNVRVEREVKDYLQSCADEQFRELSDLVRDALYAQMPDQIKAIITQRRRK